MKSIGAMIETIHGLCGTKDITEWENKFIESVYQAYRLAGTTVRLTEKQIDIIDRIYNKHFA